MRAFERPTSAFAHALTVDPDKAKPDATSSSNAPTQTVSFRVTEQEKARLERDAAGMARSAYIRERLFGTQVEARKTRGKHPVKDHEALGRVLGQLGRSGILQKLEELSWAERNGVAHIDPSGTAALRQACADIAAMRDDLIVGLGLKSVRKS